MLDQRILKSQTKKKHSPKRPPIKKREIAVRSKVSEIGFMETFSSSLLMRLQEGGFILLAAFACFLLVALATYNEADPGWSRTALDPEIKNAVGKTGAWVSDLFLFLFGYISYLYPLMIIFIGLRFFQNRLQLDFFNRWLWILRITGFIFAVTAGCGLASLHFGVYEIGRSFNAGGIFGQIISEELLNNLAPLGSTIILVATFLAGITLATGVSWFGLMDWLSLGLLSLFKKLFQQIANISLSLKPWLLKKSSPLMWLPLLNEKIKPDSQHFSRSQQFSKSKQTSFSKSRDFPIINDQENKENELFFDNTVLAIGDRLSFDPFYSSEKKSQKRRKSYQEKGLALLNFHEGIEEDHIINNNANNFNLDMDIDADVDVDKNRNRNGNGEVNTNVANIHVNVKSQNKKQPGMGGDQIHTRKAAPKADLKKVKGSQNLFPAVDLLEEATRESKTISFSPQKLENLSKSVEARLLEFGVQVKVVAILPGPVITRFELELAAGLKVSKITGLAKDLARALSVTRVRVVEVIPGKAVVGLEIPNEHREIVRLREIIEAPVYQESDAPLSLALGKDIAGDPVVVNLAKMPHLLVAGTTGSGKSVGVNAMLLSLLYKATPNDVRLILIDPKMLELSIYDGIPHLLTPVVTDMKDAANVLRWCVGEMERRYQLMAAIGVRNLVGYNQKIKLAEEKNAPLGNPLWKPEMGGERPLLSRLPYVVVIIDEFADMMMVVGKKVEELIARIAQKARAAGIHMILATQRPSVDVITGLIKANVPTRIAFQVSSRIDSRTILDQQGAEQLLGHGDMLFLAPGTGIPIRIHGAFVSDEEVHAVVKALKQLGEPDYAEDILGGGGLMGATLGAGFGLGFMENEEDGEQDGLYDQAVQIVIESRRASISHLQRRLKIGYNRAARLIETMEAAGVVSSMQSNGGREVLAGQFNDE